MIQPKILLQTTWKAKESWDEETPITLYPLTQLVASRRQQISGWDGDNNTMEDYWNFLKQSPGCIEKPLHYSQWKSLWESIRVLP
ncbi:hypothetical protein CEXT_433761 [Caerostris extrusa]|uniref:Uncharacterized protein n=1 Tax=Caerostris extrusa TaxID=172846 RepID=A0AAV4TJR2_CAEEX|nr:hypothetical protein CEXT_433761 [Caerostris extrusa]